MLRPAYLQSAKARDVGASGAADARAYVPLTDLDAELSEAVAAADRSNARRALLAHGFRLDPGVVSLASLSLTSTTFALLVLRGALLHQTQAAAAQMTTSCRPEMS